jgi:hypothetical protein
VTIRIALSPLTLKPQFNDTLVLAGPWCLNPVTRHYFLNRKEVIGDTLSRTLSELQFRSEAEECYRLYDKYSKILAVELNRVHSTNCSLRYWETLLNRFLYPLTATVIDKHEIVTDLRNRWPNSVIDIVDVGTQWVSPHTAPSFGSSRLMHLLIYSVVAVTTKAVPYEVIPADQLREAINTQGDGKKDLRSASNTNAGDCWFVEIRKKFRWILLLIRALKSGELPLSLIRYLNPTVIALGNQYLNPKDFVSLMIRAKRVPFYFNSDGWGTLAFAPYDPDRRDALRFPRAESPREEALQACIRRFLPTVFLENYDTARKYVLKTLPKSPKLILNAQHHSGGEFVDFFIAHAVEDSRSKHMMVCHGGCYGAMEVSVQEKVWARVSDIYAVWSNPRNYDTNCQTIKLPSLRFHKWLGFSKVRNSGKQILVMLTGHYPQRYAYNSIYPYTIDDEYDSWQIRFLSEIDSMHHGEIVIRDYHRSSDISRGIVREWADEHGIEVSSGRSLWDALRESRIAVQTVPQTTYLETISANHPTLCFWNPEANLIRTDLMPYFEGLVTAGILHRTPESAARKLNEIASDPVHWWSSPGVKSAVSEFRDNVCRTSNTALAEWAEYISERKIQ